MRLAFVSALLITAFSAGAKECTQNNNVLSGLVGLDGSDGRVYTYLQSESNECGCKDARFMPNNADTEKALSILMAAKIADKKVRVDFKDENSCRSGYRVYIQN